MKKDKNKVNEVILEIVLEIVLTAVFFCIGALIIGVFGVDLDLANVDFDWVVLLGIVVFAAVFGIVWALVQRIKNVNKGKRK